MCFINFHDVVSRLFLIIFRAVSLNRWKLRGRGSMSKQKYDIHLFLGRKMGRKVVAGCGGKSRITMKFVSLWKFCIAGT